MRLAHVRRDGALRLVVRGPSGWVDVATALGDARLSTLSGLLAAGAEALAGVRELGPSGTGIAPDERALGPVVDDPRRIFCVGRNYVAHRDEFANQASAWPEVFLRLGSSVTGPFDDVLRPAVSEVVDYEGEVAVVMAGGGRHIPAQDALGHVLGVTAANDVSMRDWQKRGAQWTAGKNFDGTLPLGPSLVTTDELDPTDLALETRVNGEVVQSARTSQFIFDLPEQIAFISSWTALRPGDVIVTGTPGGVGEARTPQLLLTDGDVVEVFVEGVGTLRNRIVDDGLQPASPRWRDIANRRDEVARGD
jgi:acylpyruvate hydrolase